MILFLDSVSSRQPSTKEKNMKKTKKNWLFLALALMLALTPVMMLTMHSQEAQAGIEMRR
jgi:hypothetical protein